MLAVLDDALRKPQLQWPATGFERTVPIADADPKRQVRKRHFSFPDNKFSLNYVFMHIEIEHFNIKYLLSIGRGTGVCCALSILFLNFKSFSQLWFRPYGWWWEKWWNEESGRNGRNPGKYIVPQIPHGACPPQARVAWTGIEQKIPRIRGMGWYRGDPGGRGAIRFIILVKISKLSFRMKHLKSFWNAPRKSAHNQRWPLYHWATAPSNPIYSRVMNSASQNTTHTYNSLEKWSKQLFVRALIICFVISVT